MHRRVIVHHLDQATAALRAAEQMGSAIELKSAPSAAASAGVGYLHAMGLAAGQELLIDCGDDAGLVMAALRAGCRKLLFSGGDDLRQRLDEIAAQSGAVLLGPDDHPAPCLPLSPDDDETMIRTRLQDTAGSV